MSDPRLTAKALDLMGRTEPPTACCPTCRPDEPLVFTFDRAGYEFTCLRCGRWFGFLDPRAVVTTPELDALTAQRKQEYKATREARP